MIWAPSRWLRSSGPLSCSSASGSSRCASSSAGRVSDPLPDGRAVRAAKDQEGRHAGVYGAPGREYQEKVKSGDAPASQPRKISSSQGNRSFGLGKKRAL